MSADLVALEIDTLFISDDRGRLVRERRETVVAAPRLLVAALSGELVVRVGTDVDDELIADMHALLGEPPHEPAVGWRPSAATEITELVGGSEALSTSFVFPAEPSEGTSSPFDVVTSAETSPDALIGAMPEADRTTLEPPWAMALVAGEVASVCETSRIHPDAVEAGVWTYERFRRRGAAVSATHAWSRLHGDRTVFYSADADNIASQKVAVAAGATPLAQYWELVDVR